MTSAGCKPFTSFLVVAIRAVQPRTVQTSNDTDQISATPSHGSEGTRQEDLRLEIQRLRREAEMSELR